MLKIRHVFIVLGMLLYSVTSAAQVSISINLTSYPNLIAVPGYPVYYAPRLNSNYFFYDGMYWVYQDDNWYGSNWYNGPWWLVDPEVVPLFILRIPVRYYRQPPAYFRGWRSDAPPRWGDHWGRDWEQHRSGWDRWNRRAAPAPAPLPTYQRQYSGDRYPRQVEQQQELQKRNYRYKPRDPVVQQHYQPQAVQRAPAQRVKPQQEKQGAPEKRDSKQQDLQHPTPRQQDGPAAPRARSPQKEGAPQKGGVEVQQVTPASPQQGRPEIQDQRQQPQPKATQREQQMPKAQGQKEKQQDKDTTREPKSGQEQGQERGQDRKE